MPAKEGDVQKTLLKEELTSAAVVWLDEAVVELFGEQDHGCGNGSWCDDCREDIRAEAMLWLRELNGPPSWRTPHAVDTDYQLAYRWSEHTLLADLSPDY